VRASSHPLTEDERAQPTEVVYAFTGPCDIIAAREGLAWLRERYRERGGRRRTENLFVLLSGDSVPA